MLHGFVVYGVGLCGQRDAVFEGRSTSLVFTILVCSGLGAINEGGSEEDTY